MELQNQEMQSMKKSQANKFDDYVQTRLLEQFDTTHQRNENVYRQFNDKDYTSWLYSLNQCVDNLYMHKDRKYVLSTANTVSIGDKMYSVDDNFILIDLNPPGQQKRGAKMFSMIRMFPEQDLADVKLVNYHISHQSGKAVFFYIQRNSEKEKKKHDPNMDVSGVHFFQVLNITTLRKMADDQQQEEAMLQKGRTVTVMIGVDEFPQMLYNREDLMEYQDNS